MPQRARSAVDDHAFVDRRIREPRESPDEQADGIIRIQPATSERFAEEMVQSGDPVAGSLRMSEDLPDFTLQFGRDAFIAVQYEHPVIARRGTGNLFLSTKPQPLLMHDPGPEACGDLHRAVHGAAVDDQGFVRKPSRTDCVANLARFVQRDYDDRQVRAFGFDVHKVPS